MANLPEPVSLRIKLRPGYGPPGNIIFVDTEDLWWRERCEEIREHGVYWEKARSNGEIHMGWASPKAIMTIETFIKSS